MNGLSILKVKREQELSERIASFKKIYSQGEKLPCRDVQLSQKSDKIEYMCPICGNFAQIEIEVAVDFDYGQGAASVWPYLNTLRCGICGFTLCDPGEIETLIGEKTAKELLYRDYGYAF